MMQVPNVLDDTFYAPGAVKATTDNMGTVTLAAYVAPEPGGMYFGTPVFTRSEASGRGSEPHLCVDSTGPGKRVFGVDITRHQSPDYRGKLEIPATVAVQGLVLIHENSGSKPIERGDTVLCIPADKAVGFVRKGLGGDFRGGVTIAMRNYAPGVINFAWQKETFAAVLATDDLLRQELQAGRWNDLANQGVIDQGDFSGFRTLLEYEHPIDVNGKWRELIREKYLDNPAGLIQWFFGVWQRAWTHGNDYVLGRAMEPAQPGAQFSVLLSVGTPSIH